MLSRLGLSKWWLALKLFYHHAYSYRASALSFVTLLSLVPFISVVLYFVRLLPAFSYIISFTNEYIYNNFLPSSQLVVQQYFDYFLVQSLRLPTISILFSIVTSVILINTIRHALNEVFHCHDTRLNWIESILCWFVLLFIPIFIGFSSYLNSILSSYIAYELRLFLITFLNYIILGFIFATLYIIGVNQSLDWRSSLLGGYIAALLFELSRYLFNYYISLFTHYDVIYGALGVVPIFMIWIYCIWCIILYCALLICEEDVNRPCG